MTSLLNALVSTLFPRYQMISLGVVPAVSLFSFEEEEEFGGNDFGSEDDFAGFGEDEEDDWFAGEDESEDELGFDSSEDDLGY